MCITKTNVIEFEMSSVSIPSLFRACLDNFQVVTSVKNFGVDYEMLCTELSLLQLRFQVWGESVSQRVIHEDVHVLTSHQVGLNRESSEDIYQQLCSSQPIIRETIARTLDSIIFLLNEAGKVQEAYSIPQSTANPISHHPPELIHEPAASNPEMALSEKTLMEWKDALASRILDDPKALVSEEFRLSALNHRKCRERQQEEELQKHNLQDKECRKPYRREEKRPRLQVSINSLRDRMRVNQRSIPLLSVARWALVDARHFQVVLARFRYYLDSLEKISTTIANNNHREQSAAAKIYNQDTTTESPPPYSMVASPIMQTESRPEATLSQRRNNMTPAHKMRKHLPVNSHRDYVYDEVRHRLRSVDRGTTEQAELLPTIFTTTKTVTTTTTTTTTVSNHPPTQRHFVGSEVQADHSSCAIFKSFRVGMTDTTLGVLLAALKKYNIKGKATNYGLFIACSDEERMLEPQEYPLVIYKLLKREGKRPIFWLHRIKTPKPARGPPRARKPLVRAPMSPGIETLVTTYILGYEWKSISRKGEYRYEVRAFYKHGFSMTVWRTYQDFVTLSSGLQYCFKMPLPLPSSSHQLTMEMGVLALNQYLEALLNSGDAVRLSQPFQSFLQSRDGDDSSL
jgi:hypothetical protein